MSVLGVACEYLRRGWAVVPIPHREKAPVLGGWQDLRLSEADLPRYFNGAPQNVGVLLGEPSGGLVDVDLDCPEALVLAGDFLPQTNAIFGRESKPASHRLYVCAPAPGSQRFQDVPRHKPAGGIERATLVELRSTGAQTVFPTSTHPSGEIITWAKDGPPARVDPARLQEAVKRLAAAALVVRHYPAVGTRHDFSLALAGALLRADWGEEEAERFIEAVARAAGDEEARQRAMNVVTTFRRLGQDQKAVGLPTLAKLLPEGVGERLAEWLGLRRAAWGAPARQEPEPWEPEPWEPPLPFAHLAVPPFPTDVLPAWLRSFVGAEATATQTPPDLAGMLTLAVLGVCCQKRCIVRVRDGWAEPLSVYTVVALPPGTRKTAVFQDVTEPLEAWERAETERLAPEVAEAQSKHRIAEQRLQSLQAQAAKAKPDEAVDLTREATALARELATMHVPTLPRLIVDDCTPEALARLLADQGGRLGVFADEGDVFDLMKARYGNAPNFGVFLRGHSGSNLRVDRVGRKAEFVEAPALSIGLAVQPDVIRGLTEEQSLRGRGLLARFLYAWPGHALGNRDPEAPPLPESVRAAYHDGVHRLLRLPFGTAPDGRPAPHVLTLGPDAYQRLMAFMRWLEPQLGEGGELVTIADWAAKLAGAIVRLAGLLHLAEHSTLPAPWQRPISLPTMEAAIRLGQYLLAHARYTFAEMGADPEVEDAKRLLAWIEEAGVQTFTKRDAFRAMQGSFKRVEAMEPALALLTRHGFIRECRGEQRRGPGRRPSPAYEVNPLWLCRGNSVNSVNFVTGGMGSELPTQPPVVEAWEEFEL